MEEVRPVLVAGLDTAGQDFHPVLAVPFRQVLQEVIHRIVEPDVVAVDIAHDVLVPTLDALRQSLDGDGVAGLRRQVLETEAVSRPDAVFGHAAHYVLPQVVVAVQEDVDLHHQQGLRGDVLRGTYHVLPLVVFLLMLQTVGILEDLRHHVRIFAPSETHQCLSAGKGHVETCLTAVFCQTGNNQGVPLFVVVAIDGGHVVKGFREVVFVDKTLCRVTVVTRHDVIGQRVFRLNGLEGLFQVRGVCIERLCHRIIVQVGIGSEVTGALQMGLQLVDGHAELGVIHHTGLLIQIQVEFPDVLIRLRQSVLKQLAPAHNLHTSPTRPDKCQQRLRHQGRSLTDGDGLVVTRQIVDLQQRQTCIALAHPLTVAVLHRRGKTDARHFVGEVAGTPHAAVLPAPEFRVERDAHHVHHSIVVLTRLD